MPRRRRSLFSQLVVPVVGLVLAGVLANVAFSAWLSVRRSMAAARSSQGRIVETLERSRILLSPQVLDTLHQLTGDHFVVWNERTGIPGAATISRTAVDRVVATVTTAGTPVVVTIDGRRYSVGLTRAAGVRPEQVLLLTPLVGFVETTLGSIWPVLAVAAATIAILVPLGLRTTGRLTTRITAIERQVDRIASGEFGGLIEDRRPADAEQGDEISRLVAGVNRMSVDLDTLRTTLTAGERQRLLGQLAAGFAHELRNAITGARLAIDLHRRRCGTTGRATPDESLAVASRQLDILADEVRGLLALGRPPESMAAPVDVDALVGEVRDLMAPRCEHAAVTMHCGPPAGAAITGRRDALRAALVNLTLNAIEAAGRGGRVWLEATVADDGVRFAVEDTGPGPPDELSATLHEPFVTGKPEGVGLGLAATKAVAEQHGGGIEWCRVESRTRFILRLPSSIVCGAPASPEKLA